MTSPANRIAQALDAAEPLAGEAPPPPTSADGEDHGDDEAGALPGVPDDLDWDLLRTCAAEPQNDIGNGRRLRHRFGHEIIHVQNVDYFAWDGRRWAEDVDGRVSRPMAHKVAEAIGFEHLVIVPTEIEAAAIEAAEQALTPLRAARDAMAEADDTARRQLRDQIQTLEAAMAAGRAAQKQVSSRRAARRKFAVSSGNAGKLDGMLGEALPYISRRVDDLDTETYALNLGNGTLRFLPEVVSNPAFLDADVAADVPETITRWTIALQPHAREDLISKLADVDYDPQARCPEFERFILRILPTESVRLFVQRFLGYCLTARTTEQKFCIFHGEGRNGKSTLVDLVARVMADYSTSVPISSLVNDNRAGKGSEATPDLARLPGARFVRAAEPKEGLAFDESLIKGLTSGESMPIRRLNKEFFDFYPKFKLVISANRKPTIKGNDDGIWRRVLLVPFDVQIPEEDVDRDLPARLWAERSGVLNWLVAGAMDYLDKGLREPDEVRAATREYREESDLVGAFVRGALVVTGKSYDQVEAGDLYRAYEEWCRRNGQTPVAAVTFNRRMPKAAKDAGFTKGKSSVSVYLGVQIAPDYHPDTLRDKRQHGRRGDE